jgi:adenosylmethionine-8-amino-7-oxononanoate aminotransferase
MTLSERDQNTFGILTQHKTAAFLLQLKGKAFTLGRKRQRVYRCNRLLVGESYGHSNKYIADAIYKQLTTLEHVLLAVTHEPALFWVKN